jgi:2OG-Fe(II) oxygenase superfamily
VLNQAAPTLPEQELKTMLSGLPWTRGLKPFPHLTARDVFAPEVYAAFESAFLAMIQTGQTYLPQHDIHGFTITRDTGGALAFFASRAWHDLISKLLGIKATGYVNLGLHRHTIGSANGFPHNDLNPGWFVDYESDSGIVLAQPNLCTYTTGQVREANVTPRQLVRAGAVIFYIANSPWFPGDGGETGLYERSTDPPEKPHTAIPPTNNSLLAFECTPYSLHGFIGNRRTVRHSVVMWLHRERSEAVARWGEEAIINYRV